MLKYRSACTLIVIFTGIWMMLAPIPVWSHGESVRGVGGVGIETTGGEVLREGIAVTVHYDLRKYNLFSEQQMLDFMKQGEDVHQHSREQTILMSATFGLGKRWDLSAQIGYGRFSNFQDNSDTFAQATGKISKTDVSDGLTDLLIMGRYQFYKNEERDQHAALIMGIKLPTGNYRARVNQAAPGQPRPELVGTHNQIGSGSVDFLLGTAYTGHLADVIGISADLLARVNTEGAKSFRSGNSIQVDLAVAYRPHARIVPSVELNYIAQERDIEDDEVKTNSGVTSLFVTPGVTIRLFDRHSVFANASFPVIQILPGIQNEEAFRISGGWSFAF